MFLKILVIVLVNQNYRSLMIIKINNKVKVNRKVRYSHIMNVLSNNISITCSKTIRNSKIQFHIPVSSSLTF